MIMLTTAWQVKNVLIKVSKYSIQATIQYMLMIAYKIGLEIL